MSYGLRPAPGLQITTNHRGKDGTNRLILNIKTRGRNMFVKMHGAFASTIT